MPKVSVIVPVYQVEAYIADTIGSILGQTFTDFELLIVDDGGPDRSIEICRSFTDPRIKIISQANRGLAGARNTGIRQAQGDYLAFLDGDDLWLPEKLARHVAHLDANQNVGISFSYSAFIDQDGQPLGIYQTPQLTNIDPPQVICRNPISNGSTPVIRRQVFNEIGFPATINGEIATCYFDETFRQSEDIECWLRIALTTTWQIVGLGEVLTLYRVNIGGLSANIENQLAAWERVMTKTRNYAPDFIAEWESLARAYQLRYLARWAVRMRAGETAVDLVKRALQSDARILWQEPKRTLLTLAASYFVKALPAFIYLWLENQAVMMTGTTPKKRAAPETQRHP
ncbi:glycosyltransferase family 2 protein [Synechococcus sp. PCC 6312]|uniref:glycosyltransferase family 2 protein n=1 Tax=Synechococcus sp. (strain ATCC 27167 / PCC 6312) TaxID=195253 RepID=UPI00029F4BDF|nr:glycosyltransferase family 2 protein [Synechococcus sp. PCC 6312]AFY59931.1 glycosyl transferase [Synechococcus sp. PCC 6312]